jgi:hypothetical protein
VSAPESPSAFLLRAVARMRADADRCGDPPGSFVPAVADWLEAVGLRAAEIDGHEGRPVYALMLAGYRHPVAVARAYLGEPEGAEHA